MKYSIMLIIYMLCIQVQLYAGVVITSLTTYPAIKEKVTDILYVAPSGIRHEEGKIVMLYNPHTKTKYILNESKKIYYTITAKEIQQKNQAKEKELEKEWQDNLKDMEPEVRKAMQKQKSSIMQNLLPFDRPTVNKLRQSEKILGKRAQGYEKIISGIRHSVIYTLTEKQLGINTEDLKTYGEMLEHFTEGPYNYGTKKFNQWKQEKKQYGFIVKEILLTVDGETHSIRETVQAHKLDLDTKYFQIPKGYRRVTQKTFEKISMQGK